MSIDIRRVTIEQRQYLKYLASVTGVDAEVRSQALYGKRVSQLTWEQAGTLLDELLALDTNETEVTHDRSMG